MTHKELTKEKKEIIDLDVFEKLKDTLSEVAYSLKSKMFDLEGIFENLAIRMDPYNAKSTMFAIELFLIEMNSKLSKEKHIESKKEEFIYEAGYKEGYKRAKKNIENQQKKINKRFVKLDL